MTPDGIVADDESQTIEISADPAEGISIASDEAAEVTLGIPGRSTADGVKIGDSLVYQDAATDSTVVARPTEDGAQALIVLDSPAAPSRFVFPIEVAGSPVELRAGSDGSVEILRRGVRSEPEAQPALSTLPPSSIKPTGPVIGACVSS